MQADPAPDRSPLAAAPSLTLYGHPYSRAHRVMWMLRELDVAFTHVETDFLHGGTRDPGFMAINPNGRVPVLVDDGRPIFESLAINLHLARRFGGPLASRTPFDESLAAQWSFWVTTEIEKALLFTAANLRLFAPAERRESDVALGLGKLARPLRVLDAVLRQRSWLVGDAFGVADLNVSAVMTLIPICDVPIGDYPAVAEWLERCVERPAASDWKPIMFTIPRPPDAQLMAMFL